MAGPTIVGHLYFPNGLAVRGARVEAIEWDQGDGKSLDATTTDEYGQFSLDVAGWNDSSTRWVRNTWPDGSSAPGTHPEVYTDIQEMELTFSKQGEESKKVPVVLPVPDGIGITYPLLPIYVSWRPPEQAPPSPPYLCRAEDDPLPVTRRTRVDFERGQYEWNSPAGFEEFAFCNGLPQPERIGSAASLRYFADRARYGVDIAGGRFPSPPSATIDSLRDDVLFAAQRIAGVNPRVIRKVTRDDPIPMHFPVLAEHLAGITEVPEGLTMLTLEKAIETNRLYLVDYGILAQSDAAGEPVEVSDIQGIARHLQQRYLPAPYVLLCRGFTASDGSQGGDEVLLPVAIQLERIPDAVGNPVFTRPGPQASDQARRDWEVAKLMVQVADLNHHELVSHLYETHLAMEPFVVATHRTLDEHHPIGALLRRHFFAHLFNNNEARAQDKGLISPGGGVDNLLAGGIDVARVVLRRARAGWRFRNAGLREELGKRGMLDPGSSLENYPYRDDALLVLEAVERYVGEFVDLFYQSDSQVSGDSELKEFVKELLQSGKVRGLFSMVGDRQTQFNTADELKRVVSQVIFTCSAQHSALNYPQWDYMGCVENMPGASLHDPLRDEQGASPGERNVDKLMPGSGARKEQKELVATLAIYQYDKLGHYQDGAGLPMPFLVPPADAVLFRFHRDLESVENTIRDRNNGRPLKYPYFQPSRILNSISM